MDIYKWNNGYPKVTNGYPKLGVNSKMHPVKSQVLVHSALSLFSVVKSRKKYEGKQRMDG